MNDLVSIVLPVYNGEKYLSESIDSVIAQTYQDWELIIVDDCSTDSTPTIAKKYAQNDNRIKYYRNAENCKLPKSLNVGFSHTKGDYLTWTSDDNRYHANAIERMIAAMRENNCEFVFAAYTKIDENGNKIKDKVDKKDIVKMLPVQNVIGACFMYTRNVYETIGDYDTELFLAEDFDYWQRIYGHFNAVYIREILYDYRLHDSTLTNTLRQADLLRAICKTITKNRHLFGKFDIKLNYYYYQKLSQEKELSNEPNIYKRKNKYYSVLYFWRHFLPEAIMRKLRKTN